MYKITFQPRANDHFLYGARKKPKEKKIKDYKH